MSTRFFILFFLLILQGCFKHSISTNTTSLVPITEAEYNVILDIKYATDDNFTKHKIYTNNEVFLHKDAAKRLKIAAQYADSLGYRIKIFDAFRPLQVQQELYNQIKDERYVSDPIKGIAGHTRGVALDITLVDNKTKQELNMGTPFDTFENSSHHRADIDPRILQNRVLLAGIMSVAGFTPLPSEWWHYNLRLYDTYPNYQSYPKIITKKV